MKNNRAKDQNDDKEKEMTGKEIIKQRIEIAKDLFLIWDNDGEGSLSPDELISAFIRIGLS